MKISVKAVVVLLLYYPTTGKRTKNWQVLGVISDTFFSPNISFANDQLHGRAILEKLKVTQQGKELSTSYRTRRFITAFTTARQIPCNIL